MANGPNIFFYASCYNYVATFEIFGNTLLKHENMEYKHVQHCIICRLRIRAVLLEEGAANKAIIDNRLYPFIPPSRCTTHDVTD